MAESIPEPIRAAIDAGDAPQQKQIDKGEADHQANVTAIKATASDATTAKITAIVSGALAIIAALAAIIPQVAPLIRPAPVVVQCPCTQVTPAKVLIDPSVLTDEQKKAASKPGTGLVEKTK
jgi:hypothetical protein